MKPSNKEGGFVLVEAIAALGVAAIAAASLMAVLGSVGSRSSEASVRSLALRQAQLLVEEAMTVEVDTQLRTRGELASPPLAWTRRIEPEETYPGLERIIVDVSWSNLQKNGTTRLEAYRIAPPKRT